jgi:hypothetical protein
MSTAVLIVVVAGIAAGLVMLASARSYCLRAERAWWGSMEECRLAGKYAGQAKRSEQAAADYAGQAGGAARGRPSAPPPKAVPVDGDTGEFPPLIQYRPLSKPPEGA